MDKKLNLGCGDNWKELYPDYEGLDIVDFGQKHVVNIMGLANWQQASLDWNFENNSFDEVMANHFLEHFDVDQLKHIFKWVHNILKPGGIFKFVVPHKDKDKSWVLSHKTFWCEETVNWLFRDDADPVYGFGKWGKIELVTNERKDIHAKIKKL